MGIIIKFIGLVIGILVIVMLLMEMVGTIILKELPTLKE